MTSDGRAYCISIDPELIKWVKEFAEKTGRKQSAVVEMALVRFKERMKDLK